MLLLCRSEKLLEEPSLAYNAAKGSSQSPESSITLPMGLEEPGKMTGAAQRLSEEPGKRSVLPREEVPRGAP